MIIFKIKLQELSKDTTLVNAMFNKKLSVSHLDSKVSGGRFQGTHWIGS